MQLYKPISTVVLSLAILCALAACQALPAARGPSYAITVDGAGNSVSYGSRGPETTFDVRSETGIGSAAVRQTSGEAPSKIVIRLHLNGLEEFELRYGETVVIVSVSSHGDGAVYERVRTGGAEEVEVKPDSPYWMPVQTVPASVSGGQPTAGFFEVQAPQDYIQGGNRAFAMQWVDFYR